VHIIDPYIEDVYLEKFGRLKRMFIRLLRGGCNGADDST